MYRAFGPASARPLSGRRALSGALPGALRAGARRLALRPDMDCNEQVPVLADAVQVCKQADLQILTLYSVLPAKSSAQLEQQLEELLRGKDVQRSVISIIADLEQERE